MKEILEKYDTERKIIDSKEHRKDLHRLISMVNAVTSFHRHGIKIPASKINELSDFNNELMKKYA